MNHGNFEHEYDLEKLQEVKPLKRDFRMLVTPRWMNHFNLHPYEDFTSDLLLHFLKKAALFIDVGAHYGYYTLLAGTTCPQCRVMSFEPVPENFEVLKRNINLNRLTNVETFNIAISNNNEPRPFKIAEASDCSGFSENPITNTRKIVEVTTARLDHLIDESLPESTIIKIDTEGHEIFVLEGMEKVLGNTADIILIIEFNPKCLRSEGHDPADLLRKIIRLGFEIFFVNDDKRTIYKLNDYNVESWSEHVQETCSTPGVRTYINLLCAKTCSTLNNILRSGELAFSKYVEKTEEIEARFKLLSHLLEGQKVLEIGCGNGDLSVEIAKLGFDVVGIDVSEAGIRQSVELAKKERLDAKSQFMVMDATSLDFPNNSFDTILIPEVLEHVIDSRKLLEEAVRVVRNGGRIIVSVPDGLSVPFPGHLRVFFKDTLATELNQYAKEIQWHELPFKKWLICSFFVRKVGLAITEGPPVDIMMPTYNGRKYIKNAVMRVLDQTYQNWNLIIVNDGGEDIKDILDGFQDSRIKYFVAEHKGKSHALNIGIKNSNGKYIGYLDDDDILYPLHLEVLVKAALKEKKNFVYSDWYEVSIDENNREVGRVFEFRQDVAPWMLIRQNYINHKCILHKRSLLEKTGLYDERLDVLIDWDMIRRLAFVCPPYHFWNVTSERLRYYSKAVIENRITSLWHRNPDKARRSMEAITNKTMRLTATAKDLKKAIVDAMLHRSYYHQLEINSIQQERDGQLAELNSSLQTRDSQLAELNSSLQARDSQLAELNSSLQARDSQLAELNSSLQARDARISNFEAQIQQINRGIMVQLMNRYRHALDKFLRPGTRRRYYYELGLTATRIILNDGWKSFRHEYRNWLLQRPGNRGYRRWVAQNEHGEPDLVDLDGQRQESLAFQYRPKISIITPVWNPNDRFFKLALESVINQTYDNWELCLADGSSTKPYVKKIIQKYALKDSRIKVTFLPENKGIAGNSNEALNLATGDFVGLLDHDDELAPFALYEVVKLLNDRPDVDLIYSDQDKIDEKGKHGHIFSKPDFSMVTLLSANYIGQFVVCRKALIERVDRFRYGFDGSQDYDLLLRIAEATTKDKIKHIPKVLYHWRIHKNSSSSGRNAKPYAYLNAIKALSDFLGRKNIKAEIVECSDAGSYKIKKQLLFSPVITFILFGRNDHEIANTIQCIDQIKYKHNVFIVNNAIFTEEFLPLKDSNIFIFIDCELNPDIFTANHDWIDSLAENIGYFRTGLVGTGSWIFKHIIHELNRPCGKVFATIPDIFINWFTESRYLSSDFDEIQIKLSDFSRSNGYSNIFTPFSLGDLTVEISRISKYQKETTGVSIDKIKPIDLRQEFASKYIRGIGIEIGPLHQPLKVPPNVIVDYVDRLPYEVLLVHYPEISKDAIIHPDIIDDAQKLGRIEDESYEFCICNHVLEHMVDPLEAIANWWRVLKPGGIIYLSVPYASNPLDAGRKITTMEHLIEDHLKKDDGKDFEHYIECAKYWNKLSQAEALDFAKTNQTKNYSIHYHVFDRKSLDELFSYLQSNGLDINIIDFAENVINSVREYIYILEKANYIPKIVELLEDKHHRDNINSSYLVDVIVPIYNAFDDVVKCLYSLIKCQSIYRIILINDYSTDQKVNDLLRNLKKYEYDWFRIIDNAKNLGFVITANRGMEISSNDIILLNSDTVVTNDWAEKLRACARSDIEIATVTPFTNNGTICSIPVFMKNNGIPEGFTIDSFADLVDKASFKRYPEIPTAVGFCMYIKRSVIDEIGFFNEEIFGKGYCEENDFCMRAIRKKYINVLCDDTFIFHKGQASFIDAQNTIGKKNLDVLSRKYPDYLPTVAGFIQSNPLKELQDNIKRKMPTWDTSGKKKRILFVLHHWGGGTEKYALELVDSLNKYYVFYILQVIDNKIILTENNNNNRLQYEFILAEPIKHFAFYSKSYKEIVKSIIATFQINLIHIHHLIGHTFDIVDIAQDQKIPIMFTICDYYVMCPAIFLVDDKGNYCMDTLTADKCSGCLSRRYNLQSKFIANWRSKFAEVFRNINLVIALNPAVLNTIRHCYNLPKSKTLLLEPGHQKELFTSLKYRPTVTHHKPFCIAYVGVLDSSHKGLDLFYRLAGSKILRDKIKWMIIGTSELHKKPGFYPKHNVYVYGKYKDFIELKEVLQEEVDLVIHPSLCETFSYTLSETWAAGIPALVSNVGALAERVNRTGGGWVMDVANINKVEETILDIINSPKDYMIKREAVNMINLKKMDDASKEFRMLYEQYIRNP